MCALCRKTREVAVFVAIFAALGGVAGAAEAPAVDFSRQVRPILSDKCFKCHGPDEQARQAELRLDIRESAEAVLSPANPTESELVRRITSSDGDERMPPADSNLSLTAPEIETLRQWIAEGAPYRQHWSFTPIADLAIPAVTNAAWPRNEIDHFVLAKLEAEKLAPSPEASRERLIRRLSFDLTGLPPTLAEIDTFLADQSPDAYAQLVDRLLAKEEYGERMAVEWLDLARYSDTYGYQVDRDRFVWPWRDWVISALNDNLPYDQFLTWQLAGDLLPEATDQQVLATTFNRLHPQESEGGSVPEEFRVRYVSDRNHTFAMALLGLTLECAQCHDHKFDPIRQKEYYQLYAYFNNIDEAGLYSYFTPAIPTPTLVLADDSQKAKIADVEHRIAEAEEELHKTAELCTSSFRTWLEARPQQAEIPGRVAHLEFEDLPEGDGAGNRGVPGRSGRAARLTGDDEINLEVGNFQRFEPFSVALWMNSPDAPERAVVFHRSRAWTDAASRGYELLIEDGRLSAALIHFWPGNAIRVQARDPIPVGEWLHVALVYDGSSRADGLRLFVDGRPAACDVVRDKLTKNITGGGGDNIAIGARFRDRGFIHGLVDDLQVYSRQLTPLEVAELHDGASLSAALHAPIGELTSEQEPGLREYYLATADADYQRQLAALRAVREERTKVVDELPEIMVMRELEERRPTSILARGAYDAPGEHVEPGTPAVFPPLRPGEPNNRLGLAHWLTAPEHPLTARVAANRFWQILFGVGLVRTPEDFGSQGEPPTHPELLDWLARDFLEHGWDVKRLFKTIVTSATYRQDSIPTPEGLARDPDNRLLARSNRYRLSAEMVRDNALATSGLLVRKIGGEPVRPYEVEVAYQPTGRDKGEGLYRRSMYTYWKRTGPAPVLVSLDAAKRDVCVVRRERTSSPLQALVLLNGPQFVEAARVLGQRLLQQHGDNIDSLIDELFRTLTSRQPTEREREILTRLYNEQLGRFEANTDAAAQFLQTGDAARDESLAVPRLAAAAVLASAIMNYDECLMRR